jgi:hypothetical protein
MMKESLHVEYRGQVLSSFTWEYSRLWHRVVVPAAGLHRLADRYDNPMLKLTISLSEGLRILIQRRP